MPTKYGSYKRVWERHKKWSDKGVCMEKYYEFPGVTWIYFWIDIDRRPFCGQQHCSSQERGQQIGFDGHKKTKGSKIHVAVTPQCLPIAIDLGSGNEHESRKLIPLLNDIQIKNKNGRPKSRPERIWADTKYHTFLVLTYLYNRRIRAQIKQRRNTKPKQGRPHVFLYRDYRRVRSSVERFFGWLKSFRRIQTRYERLALTYLGFV